MCEAIKYIDTLIIGQGLAGSLLGYQLIKLGQNITIVCDEHSPSASRVAAGLFNPVTGQRMVLQEQAEHIIPTARQCYQTLERELGQTLFHEKTMLRIFKHEKEQKNFEKRRQDSAYAPYLDKQIDSAESILAPYGLGEQMQTGYLDTNALLDSLRDNFIEQQSYISAHFEYSDLKHSEHGIEWKNIHAKRIIFCQGFMDKDNPWFNYLPFQPAKGEILTLKSSTTLPEEIINGGKWLLPLHDGRYKTGATYSHDLSHLDPMPEAKTELLNGLQKLFDDAPHFDLVVQQAGVRPNTLDKHPFIGFHPKHSHIAIFNGFGSKGSMLIPHYAQAFAQHLEHNTAIPREADISRIKLPTNKTATPTGRLSLTGRVHQMLLPHILSVCKQGDCIAIDATAGNGHDSLFLAHQIKSRGQLFAFDIQQQAINNTEKRLNEAGVADNTTLICCGHEQMLEHIPNTFLGKVNLIVFNLGYLPRAEKTVITQKETTIQALDAAIQLIAPLGRISILAYPGHAGGDQETYAVNTWLEKLPKHRYSVIKHDPLHGSANSPQWFEVVRQSQAALSE